MQTHLVLCKWGTVMGNSRIPPVLKNTPSFEKLQISGAGVHFPGPAFWMAKSQIFRMRRAEIEWILVT